MLHERVESRLLDGDFRLAVGVVVGALLDFLVQHFEEVLLTGGNVPAKRVEEVKRAKQMHKVTEHLLALQDWSVFLEHRNDDFIAVGLRRAALGELLQILIDFLLLLLMLVAFCERERTQFGVGYYPRAGENEKKDGKHVFINLLKSWSKVFGRGKIKRI